MHAARAGFGAALNSEIIRDYKLDMPLDSDFLEKQKTAINNGHCNALPSSAVEGMVNAQIARDVWMAKVIRDNSANGLILIAGNGHVQKDIGVVRWLSDTDRARTKVIGFIESDDGTGKEAETQLYDQTVRIKPFEREDPCKAFIAKSKIKT
jgi:hypothetical protein